MVPQVTVFDYKSIDAHQSFWQGLSNAGNELFRALQRDGAQYGVNGSTIGQYQLYDQPSQIAKRPFVIVGSGFGGVVLKQVSRAAQASQTHQAWS